jgi:hypothetical protein
MEVEGAGLLAEACHILCQNCWAFHIARFHSFNGCLESSFGGNWRAQVHLLWSGVIEASWGKPWEALLS